jgi:hypothetical protein
MLQNWNLLALPCMSVSLYYSDNLWNAKRIFIKFDIRVPLNYKKKSNKMQQCIKILLFQIYMKLNMFRATHRPSSEA